MKKGTRDTVLIRMKSGIWDQENYPIVEYGKRENMNWEHGIRSFFIFELGNLQGPLGSPLCVQEHFVFGLYTIQESLP